MREATTCLQRPVCKKLKPKGDRELRLDPQAIKCELRRNP